MKLKELESIVENEVTKEQSNKVTKAQSTERQERAFVEIVNKYASSKRPINLEFENGFYIKSATGAKKVSENAPSGKEAYTDVKIYTSNGDTFNLSMKGPTAPSSMGGGTTGIASLYPNFLPVITAQAIEYLKKKGFKKGDWWIDSKNMKSLARVLLKRTFKQGDPYYKKDIVMVGWDGDNPDVQFPLWSWRDLKEVGNIPKTSASELDFGPKGLPDFFGGNESNRQDIERGNKVYLISDDLTDVEPYINDMYFLIDPSCIDALFIGNEFMGGPIDYVYKGPMNVEGSFSKKENALSLNASLLEPEDYKVSPQYLRIRRRRLDQPFNPELEHPELGYQIFDRGVFSGEKGTRPVIVSGKFSNILGTVSCNIENISYKPSQNESLTKAKITYKMLEQMVEEAIKKAR